MTCPQNPGPANNLYLFCYGKQRTFCIPIVIPAAVKKNIHVGNITLKMEYRPAPIIAAGTGGKRSRFSSKGTWKYCLKIVCY